MDNTESVIEVTQDEIETREYELREKHFVIIVLA